MVVWALTAGIGIYLLAVGIAAQRVSVGGQTTNAAAVADVRPRRVLPRYESVMDDDPDTDTTGTDTGSTDTGSTGTTSTDTGTTSTDTGTTGTGTGAATENAMVTGAAALATVLNGQQLAAEQPRASRPAAEESALLEFLHPALALLGLTIWIFFMVTGDRLFAWIAFGVVVATVAAGASWEAARRKKAHARQRAASQQGASFPPHLIMLHGLAAVCTFALVVIAAVVAGHG